MADGDLASGHFPFWFDFTRPTQMPYRDADGALQTADIDVARFDHEEDGTPLGLLVERGAALGLSDRAVMQDGALEEYAGTDCTVLHAQILDDGSVERRAWYSRAPATTITAMLGTVGHHASIGVIPGFRENKGGHVRYRGFSWYLMGFIEVGDGSVLSDDSDRPLIGA